MVNSSFWKGRKVAITGDTGFKGSWLSLWLLEMKTKVFGFALKPDTNPSLFDKLGISNDIHHKDGDIRDYALLFDWLQSVKPEVIFHLAAQPLVRRSYKEPLLTWGTNVIGTVNLLQAARELNIPCSVVVVTSDKVYENTDSPFSYREIDQLGGYDPYSSSKSAAELAVSSWRSSFFDIQSSIRIATARAGNVIGGGDWAQDRIVPDLVRSLLDGIDLKVRNPNSVRPWQHVLEPLSGYILLAEKLASSENSCFQGAFNFGPESKEYRKVGHLIEEAFKHWPGRWKELSEFEQPYEASTLGLTIDKAKYHLGWKPKWNFSETVQYTMEWYRSFHSGEFNTKSLCQKQIKEFSN